MLGAWLSQAWSGWRPALVFVKPDTVLAWHRRGFRLFWTGKSRYRTGGPAAAPEVRALIRRIAAANPLWGAPRIHGELQKLGISVSQATVAKYMPRRNTPPSQAWRTFPAQQLRNAFPDDHVPRYLLHDRDAVFTDVVSTIGAMPIHALVTAPRSPWQNAYVERLIGSIRRECLDHVIVLSRRAPARPRRLRRVLHERGRT